MNRYTAEIRIDRPLAMAAIQFHLEKQIRDRIGHCFSPENYQVSFDRAGDVAIARMVPISEFAEVTREIRHCVELAQTQDSDSTRAG